MTTLHPSKPSVDTSQARMPFGLRHPLRFGIRGCINCLIQRRVGCPEACWPGIGIVEVGECCIRMRLSRRKHPVGGLRHSGSLSCSPDSHPCRSPTQAATYFAVLPILTWMLRRPRVPCHARLNVGHARGGGTALAGRCGGTHFEVDLPLGGRLARKEACNLRRVSHDCLGCPNIGCKVKIGGMA